MPENGAIYVLTGPDGTRAVVNDPTDSDFVGYLDAENGITGLLDSAEVRESVDVRSGQDGGIQGNNYLGRRTGTMQGIIWPDPSMASANQKISKLMRASRGLRSTQPAVLTWTPSGGVRRMINVWRQNKVTTSARRPKTFLVPLATADPYTYSAALNSTVLTPGGVAGDAGFGSPISSPLGTVYQVQSQLFISNQGDAETWPQFVIQGPITNPTLLNNTTGLSWRLTYTLQATDTIVVDAKTRTVLLNGSTNRYGAFAANLSTNTWWSLLPGSNDIRLLSAAFSAGAQVTVNWRDAYEY